MRIFKYTQFKNWAESEKINDKLLKKTIEEISNGLFEAYLGGNLYKKRIARKGQGKRKGYRTIIAFKKNDKAFFLYGFSKNERDNVSAKEEFVYKKLAGYYLNLNEFELCKLKDNKELTEVLL